MLGIVCFFSHLLGSRSPPVPLRRQLGVKQVWPTNQPTNQCFSLSVFCVRLLRYTKEGVLIRRQDFIVVVQLVSLNPSARSHLWDWVRRNWQDFVDRYVDDVILVSFFFFSFSIFFFFTGFPQRIWSFFFLFRKVDFVSVFVLLNGPVWMKGH